MFVTVTVKAEAESEGELVNTFGSSVATMRQHFDMLKAEGILGDPAHVDVRYLIIGAGCRAPEPVAQERVSGKPDVE